MQNNYNIKRIENINSGIYCIYNKVSDKRYIGQTYDLRYRKSRHMSDLRRNKHSNNHLQASFNKYGENNFDFLIIEYCDLTIINEREIYWIDYYDCIKKGYNQCIGGLGCRGYKHTEEEIVKMRKVYNPKKVLQLDMDGNIIYKWESASQAAKKLNLYIQSIKNCCEQKNGVKSIKGFIWIYEENKDTINMNYYFNKNISNPKPVLQFDLNWNYINTWISSYDAEKNGGFSASEISKVCSGNKKSHKGFIWIHKENLNNINKQLYINKNSLNSKIVIQYDLQMNFIKEWNSTWDAHKNGNFDSSAISKVCLGKQNSHKGYIFRYKNECNN